MQLKRNMDEVANLLYDYHVAIRLSGGLDPNQHLAEVRKYFKDKYGKEDFRTKFIFQKRFNYPLLSQELEEIRFLLHSEVLGIEPDDSGIGHAPWLKSIKLLIEERNE